ncbi:hypothetical protein [Pyruvatibacter mobilis]|uniref:hypothetical protein n=1 Tax=Pyruvatibacter mobilis TaxID=1712261 RepID=UPI003BAC778B
MIDLIINARHIIVLRAGGRQRKPSNTVLAGRIIGFRVLIGQTHAAACRPVAREAFAAFSKDVRLT